MNTRPLVCITGASGMVGNAIARLMLADDRQRIRVLSRKSCCDLPGAELISGDLLDSEVVATFLDGAGHLYHCAAELHQVERMWPVNVEGTRLLMQQAALAKISKFCFLSSAGVVGTARSTWIDETHPCNPRNAYEKSKHAAEQLAQQGLPGCSTVIIRPTNVIDDKQPGALLLPARRRVLDRLALFLKGGECTHLVHADDVAAAAVFLTGQQFAQPESFFVSCDDEPLNTLAGLWSLYDMLRKEQKGSQPQPAPHLSLLFPHLLRRLMRGEANRGDVKYTNRKLLQTGFTFPLGLWGAVQRIAEKNTP